jgi:hypothetical protein
LETFVALIAGIVLLAFGVHAIKTERVTFGDSEDNVQIWLYGWRAVAIGCLALAVAALFFLSAAGFIHLDW